ncbi:MAG: cobalamin biosynthesis protein [Lachnospiraceae bacterium]|nr:cobalamin biosynthesis protein [Lachnospiraceae bacterium]
MTGAGIEAAEAYTCSDTPDECGDTVCDPEGIRPVTLDGFVKDGFKRRCALIFVGAAGIAVRTIAPYVKDKLSDSPVIVIDDNGNFVIPMLSGHAGGANKLAVTLAELIDAIPVITTSTDAGEAFSADVFAIENNLTIRNREGIKKVSAKAIEGKPITLSIKDYPPEDAVDVMIADETDREYSLLLSPKRYVAGLGLKKGREPEAVAGFFYSVLKDNDIGIDDIYALATIDIKADDAAIKYLSEKHRIPVIAFDAPLLEKAKGDFSSSEFVRAAVGVDNVCERAAVLAAGPSGRLITGKIKGEGMTVAIAVRYTDEKKDDKGND